MIGVICCARGEKKFSACKQFFNLEIDARIIAAAFNLLGLQSLDGIPDKCVLPTALKEASLPT